MQSNPLSIHYYVESGCLGAHGDEEIQRFCQFLNDKLQQKHTIATWYVKQLIDIHQPHIQYFLAHKKLSQTQTDRYLDALKLNKDVFEENIDDWVIDLIDDYLKR